VDFLQAAEAMAAAKKSVELLAARTTGTGGLILLDREGTPGWAFNTPRMAYGYVKDGELIAAVE
jgi:beta-aspartyl-peptidase (threonine type)